MQQSINFTKRKRILKKHFTFSTSENSDKEVEFSVELAHFDGSGFPKDARVYIEAYANITSQTFSCGTISDLKLPSNEKLKELDKASSPLFRVKVVDEHTKIGLILASGEQFSARDDIDEDVGLLPLVALPLEALPWKVNFEPTTFELVLNNKIPGVIDLLKKDEMWQALVYPIALKEILLHLIINEEEDRDENTEQWMNFAESLVEKPDNMALDDNLSWIDEVIECFCKRHDLTGLLVKKMEGESS